MTLPYEFDASDIAKTMLRGVAGLLVLLVVGILYSLLVTHNMATVAQLLLVTAIVMYFGRLFLRNLTGSEGTISSDAVNVRPARLFGIELASPKGKFPVQQFMAVHIEVIFGGVSAPALKYARVSFIGKTGTPDILVALSSLHTAKALGKELAAALDLPYEERIAPY